MCKCIYVYMHIICICNMLQVYVYVHHVAILCIYMCIYVCIYIRPCFICMLCSRVLLYDMCIRIYVYTNANHMYSCYLTRSHGSARAALEDVSQSGSRICWGHVTWLFTDAISNGKCVFHKVVGLHHQCLPQ